MRARLPQIDSAAGRAKLQQAAFTLIELLCTLSIIAILAALVLPTLSRAKARSRQIECVSNLRETGLAFHMFANDHSGKFTFNVSTNQGGSLEFVVAAYGMIDQTSYLSFQHFLPLKGALVTPKLLACPSDRERVPETDFSRFSDLNLSYAVGLKADPNIPNCILAADRNLPACSAHPTIRRLYGPGTPPPPPPYWSADLHQRRGNILFSDSHVEESSDANFGAQISVIQDLVYPDVPATALAISHYPPTIPSSPTSPTAPASPASVPATQPGMTSSTSPAPAPRVDQQAGLQASYGSAAEPQPKLNIAPPVVAMPVTAPVVAKAHFTEPPLKVLAVQAAQDSWEAASWLLWLLLLILVLIFAARWLERRLTSSRAKW